MITTILFDLDGTLLPLNEELFIKIYFGGISQQFAKLGYDQTEFIHALWQGTLAMKNNQGEKTNEVVFWETFLSLVSGDIRILQAEFEHFYLNDFDQVKKSTFPSLLPRKIIDFLTTNQYRVILATNPLFPKVATEKRIRWAGLSPSDFELITTYETNYFSKPNPKYYQRILDDLGLSAEECLMIGNDCDEDMIASSIGMQTFLLTDCLNNVNHIDISKYENGSMEDLYQKIIHLPKRG